jgi:hypothetical protein
LHRLAGCVEDTHVEAGRARDAWSALIGLLRQASLANAMRVAGGHNSDSRA